MSLYISAICSGSNGNCYYIGNDNEAVLIDAGISCREIEKRMLRNKLDIQKVKAVFVTHEHGDHIFGLKTLSSKYQLPVYFTPETCKHCNAGIEPHLIYHCYSHQIVQIGALRIKPFPKQHDACDPHSFIVCDDDVCAGVFTDIGAACQQITHYFKQCHAAFLETNYDKEMLMKGRYPYYLKRRISSDHGHLSNHDALELFVTHRSPFLSYLILSHLSQQNNKPELVSELFAKHAQQTNIIVASRYRESEVYNIDTKETLWQQPVVVKVQRPVQLTMF